MNGRISMNRIQPALPRPLRSRRRMTSVNSAMNIQMNSSQKKKNVIDQTMSQKVMFWVPTWAHPATSSESASNAGRRSRRAAPRGMAERSKVTNETPSWFPGCRPDGPARW